MIQPKKNIDGTLVENPCTLAVGGEGGVLSSGEWNSANWQTVNDGDNQISFQAYFLESSSAIANKAITLGEFSATATFEIVYE